MPIFLPVSDLYFCICGTVLTKHLSIVCGFHQFLQKLNRKLNKVERVIWVLPVPEVQVHL